jgi:hypothetical protein
MKAELESIIRWWRNSVRWRLFWHNWDGIERSNWRA